METAPGRFTQSVENTLRLVYELSQQGLVSDGRSHESVSHESVSHESVSHEGFGHEGVTGSRLVERNGLKHASVTNMLKKLEEMGLVWREPYYGVGLTDEGQRAALTVIRRHRIIELYLAEALGYTWDEVHEEAEGMEHAASEQFIDRLERLLGYPEADAHGWPIPTREGEISGDSYASLAGLDVGERATVRRVLDRDPEVLRHLAGLGLIPGVELEILERHPFDGPLIVAAGEGSLIASRKLARHVFVESVPAEKPGAGAS